jgi:hypothetical protein
MKHRSAAAKTAAVETAPATVEATASTMEPATAEPAASAMKSTAPTVTAAEANLGRRFGGGLD